MLEVTVEKRLGDFTLDAAFTCRLDGLTALFGRSGAGKTTIVNMLAGLVKPDAGRIVLGDVVLFDSARNIDLPPHRRRLGYVFQEDRLFPHRSVMGNLLYGWRRAPAGERAIEPREVTALLGLDPLLERRPAELSGGEKQRVAIGRALLANPRLLLMDEPLANLDHARKDEVLAFIERLQERFDVAIVYVSHAMEEIVRLADTLVLVDAGRIAAVGPVEDLTARLDLRPLTGRYEAGAAVPVVVEEADAGDGLSALSFDGGRLLVAGLGLAEGQRLRLRVRARDVSVALSPPEGLSSLNVLPAVIEEITPAEGAFVDLRLRVGATPFWARIAERSRRELDLKTGMSAYAVIKAVAIDRHNLGRAGQRREDVWTKSAGNRTETETGRKKGRA